MYCEECGSPYTEGHHIIFRKQAPSLKHFYLNEKRLCPKCHRGKNGPHKNREKDLEYKREYQRQVEALIIKDYYTEEALQKTLKMSRGQVRRLVKPLNYTGEGYAREDIIKALCGGRNYL